MSRSFILGTSRIEMASGVLRFSASADATTQFLTQPRLFQMSLSTSSDTSVTRTKLSTSDSLILGLPITVDATSFFASHTRTPRFVRVCLSSRA